MTILPLPNLLSQHRPQVGTHHSAQGHSVQAPPSDVAPALAVASYRPSSSERRLRAQQSNKGTSAALSPQTHPVPHSYNHCHNNPLASIHHCRRCGGLVPTVAKVSPCQHYWYQRSPEQDPHLDLGLPCLFCGGIRPSTCPGTNRLPRRHYMYGAPALRHLLVGWLVLPLSADVRPFGSTELQGHLNMVGDTKKSQRLTRFFFGPDIETTRTTH